jgi:hypothetical protein
MQNDRLFMPSSKLIFGGHQPFDASKNAVLNKE